MSYPKLLEHVAARKEPVTVYLGREAFERGVTRHLGRKDARAGTDAILHLRLSSYACLRALAGPAAARKLLHSAASILLRTSSTLAAVYLGEGAFAVLMSDVQAAEAELHAHFLAYSISDMVLQQGTTTLCSDAFVGLTIADGHKDGKALLAAAGEAGLVAEEKSGGRSSVECAGGTASSEAQEHFITAHRITGISFESAGLAALTSR